jgi:retinol-binding protein 3
VRTQVIDGALKALNDNYVYPDVAQRMEQAIRGRQQRGEYDRVTSGRQLAQLLTDRLRSASRDRHLSVNYSPDVLAPQPPASPDSRLSPEAQAEFDRWVRVRPRDRSSRFSRLP